MGGGVGGGGKGGGQATSNGQPVYYDSTKGQYYTMNTPQNSLGPVLGAMFGGIIGRQNDGRNYLGNSLNNASGNFQQSTSTPNVYNASYPQPTGEAFNNGINSDSGLASILAGLYSSGVFNQQNTNPYAPQGTVGSFTGIPYGQQQESMFSRQGLAARPYGGYQGQSWNPYGNYYTSNNNSMSGGNTNNNIAPPPGTTGPDAIQQLSFMMNRNNTQI